MLPGFTLIIHASGGHRAPPLDPPAGQTEPLPAEVLARPILVIEDEVLIAWQVQDLLHDMGFTEVHTAGSHAEALLAAEAIRPALLVCDVNLGAGPDGIAAAEAARREGPVATLFITGYAGAEIEARIAAACPDARLLRKPIEAARLARALRAVLMPTLH